ncbi:MAG: hypothetical protein CMJ31_13510 [Phycisphaerae bacterium]|nr:hypothetical protein [Phycisphaerae bacterium]
MTSEPASDNRSLVLLGVMLAAIGVRSLTGVETFPHWHADPFTAPALTTTLTSTTGMLADLVIAASALIVLWLNGARSRVEAIAPWLVAVAGLVIALHALTAFGGTLDDAPRGVSWLAAALAGLAASRVRSAPSRAFALAICLGLFAPMLLKGMAQVFIEHPALVESYRRDPASFAQSKGWTPGSAAARQFERRLLQSEMSAWFALSNVFASFAAAAVVAFGVMTVRSLSRWRSPVFTITALATLASAAALFASHSKGGVGAALLGGGLVITGLLVRRVAPRVAARKWFTAALGLAAIALPLLAIGARAAIGPDGMGELSLMVRAFYLEGAVRVFAEHPLIGVGPEGFQSAYALAKPPLATETVTSPHSVLFDWLATLGLGGVALSAALGLGAIALGRAVLASFDRAETSSPPPLLKPIALIGAITVLLGLLIERPALTPELALVRFAGFGAMVAAAWAILRLNAAVIALAAAAAALVLLAHAQIEMTPTRMTSAALCFTMIGLGVSPAASAGPHNSDRPMRVATLALTATVIASALAFAPIAAWERKLSEAEAVARPVGMSAMLLRDAAQRNDQAALNAVATEIAALSNTTPPRDLRAAIDLLERARRRRSDDAIEALRKAVEIRPDHLGTREALSRLLLHRALLAGSPQDLNAAIEVAEGGATERPNASAAWQWLGVVREAAMDAHQASGAQTKASEARAEAVAAFERAAALDPSSPSLAARIMRLLDGYDEDAAVRWATEAIRLHGLTRLDPTAGLPDEDLRLARRLVDGPAHPSAPADETPNERTP